MALTTKFSLLIFRGEETIGEYPFTIPYGESDAVLEPLRKLKPEFCGVVLGRFGVTAHSAALPTSHPFYRANAAHA